MPQQRRTTSSTRRPVVRSAWRRRFLGAATTLVLAACNSAAPAATAPSSATATDAATPSVTADRGWTGEWTGALEDPSGSYPVRLSLTGCRSIGYPCGELEYLDSAGGNVQCASELTLTERDGERFAFSERYVYHGWNCFQTTYGMTRGADGNLSVEQFGEPGVVCCRGTFIAVSSTPAATPVLPATIAGLGQATSSVALGGGATQYAAAGDGSLWFPIEDLGTVARVDPATGLVVTQIEVGDPGSLVGLKSDPHGVAAGDAGIWVAQAAAKAVGRIDPATNTVIETSPLAVIPYALALDGTTLWATSFEDDRVVRIDLTTHKVVADIAVNKPTGIAVGLGGVWVVRHRDDTLVRIDPSTNKVVAEISLGDRGPSEVCGMCVENVIVSDGSVWTANNEGRSVSRIDPATNKVANTIALPLRPWAVTAGGGSIWASQFDANADGAFVGQATWGVVRIDPASNAATSTALPGAFGVLWAEDALWVITPGRRGDVLVRIELEG